MKVSDQKIIPNLWLDDQAEEAVNFYISVFENSGINSSSRFPDAGKEIHGKEAGSIMTIDFQLEELKMVALNGGPHFQFNPSVSLFVICKDENEVNRIWGKLIAEGKFLMPLDTYDWSSRYGWLQDRYGLNWQLMVEDPATPQNTILPLLFFTGKMHGRAEEAIHYYTSIFKNSNIEGILYYGKENSYAESRVQHAQFQLENQTFMAMDSGVENNYPFNEAISFIVMCEDQQEIDYYWEKLSEGGDPGAQQCGWLKDKFDFSWQVVPTGMDKILNDPDKARANKAMEAMLKMKKINLKKLLSRS